MRLPVLLYRAALRLYPAPFRAAFGEEMAEVFEEATRRAATRGPWSLVRLCLREAAGLAGGLAREHATRESLAAFVRIHGAPLAAGLAAGGCFLLGAVLAGGPFVFHLSVTLLAGAALAGGSILAGRAWAAPVPLRRRLLRIGSALLIVTATLPAARLTDHLWLHLAARSGGEIAWSLPGLDVQARRVTPAGTGVPWNEILPEDRRGHIYSGSLPAGGGQHLAIVWHRLPSAPPYELIIVLAGGSLAAASHALRRRRPAPLAG